MRNLYGIPVRIVKGLGETRVQFRFPSTRKKRIRTKWSRDPANWKTVQEPQAYRMNVPCFCCGTLKKEREEIFMNDAFAKQMEIELDEYRRRAFEWAMLTSFRSPLSVMFD